MILTISEFIEKTNHGNEIPDQLRACISGEMREDHRDKEYASWVNSYRALAMNFANSNIPKAVNVILEYNLKQSVYRCDVILAGKKAGQDKLLIIELKQWEQGNVIRIDDIHVRAYGKCKEHPIIQVLDYKKRFDDSYTSIVEDHIKVEACAYLHNYDFTDPLEKDAIYAGYEEHIFNEEHQNRLFGRSNSSEFEDFLSEAFDETSETVINRILNSEIKINDVFIDHIQRILEGKPVFKLTEDQLGVIDQIVEHRNIDENMHHVFIVKGGPGTGKTVLAFHLLLKMVANKEQKGVGFSNVTYATKNAQLVNSYLSVLKKNGKNNGLEIFDYRTLNMLFSQINPVLSNDMKYDCLIVDETQRLQQSFIKGNEWQREILETLVEKTKNLVLLLDEDQKLAFNDVEFTNEIRKIKNMKQVRVFPCTGEELEYTLYQPIRTFGSREHLNWIDHFLGYERMKELPGRIAKGYDMQVVSTPDDLFYMVHDKVAHGESARVLSGLCWLWKEESKNDHTRADIKIVEGGRAYTYSWNSQDIKDWTANEGTIDEVGCVHTVLGQEFDYAGVIIGDDLIFDGEQVVPNPDKNMQFMRYDDDSRRVNGMPLSAKARSDIKVLSENKDKKYFEEAKELVRNHYHILLSRGKKGCYIYCTNPALREHLCRLLNQEQPNSYGKRCDLPMARWEGTESRIVIGNSFNHSYHRPDCKYAPMNPSKRVEFKSVEEAEKAGYKPCGNCRIR